jgi:hypothetical protein
MNHVSFHVLMQMREVTPIPNLMVTGAGATKMRRLWNRTILRKKLYMT